MKNKEERLNFMVYQVIAKDSKFGIMPFFQLIRLGQVIVVNKLDEKIIAEEIRKTIMISLNLKRAITKVDDIEVAVNKAYTKGSQRSELIFHTKKNECVVIVIECEYNREDADHFVMTKVR